MKFVTRDYVVDPTTHAKLGFQGSNGIVPHSGEIYTQSVYFFFLSRDVCAAWDVCARRSCTL